MNETIIINSEMEIYFLFITGRSTCKVTGNANAFQISCINREIGIELRFTAIQKWNKRQINAVSSK